MKKLLVFIFFLLGTPVFAQLNTFSDGDVVSAEKMNQNFEYLADRFGISKATVDCNAGATSDPNSAQYTTIMEALVEHNYLTITGMCNEEVVIQGDQEAADISAWPDEREDEGTNFSDFAAQSRHRLVILEGGAGGNASNGIGQVSNNDQIHLISLRGQISLVISKLRLVGGKSAVDASRGAGLRVVDSYIAGNGRHGLGAWENVHLTAIGNTIEGTTGTSSGFSCGIQLWGNSFGVLLNNTVDNHPHGGAICLHQSSAAFVFGNTLSNSRDGLNVQSNSSAVVGNGQNAGSNDIFDNRQGISMGESSNARVYLNSIHNNTWNGIRVYASSNLTLGGGTKIYGNAEDGISADSSSIDTWCDDNLANPTLFKDDQQNNPNGNNAISLGKNATAYLCHLDLSGHKRGINAWIGSTFSAENILIANSTYEAINLTGANAEIRDSTISGIATDSLIGIRNGSTAEIRDSTLSSTSSDEWNNGIYLSETSTLKFQNSTLETSHRGLTVERNSYAEMRDGASITSSGNRAIDLSGSAGLKIREESSITATGGAGIVAGLSSWVEIDGGNGSSINRTDAGADIELNRMSMLSIYDGNSLGEVSCSGKSYAEVADGSVETLSENCL